jgi:hypothetical protein
MKAGPKASVENQVRRIPGKVGRWVIHFPAVARTSSASIPESDAAIRRTAEGSGTENSVRGVRPNSDVSIE